MYNMSTHKSIARKGEHYKHHDVLVSEPLEQEGPEQPGRDAPEPRWGGEPPPPVHILESVPPHIQRELPSRVAIQAVQDQKHEADGGTERGGVQGVPGRSPRETRGDHDPPHYGAAVDGGEVGGGDPISVGVDWICAPTKQSRDVVGGAAVAGEVEGRPRLDAGEPPRDVRLFCIVGDL